MSNQNLPESVEAVFPLSPTQQGMLYHSLHTPGSGMYSGQHCFELNNVDVDCLARAWDLIVARHSSLRSVFAWRGLSKSVQVIYKSAEAEIVQLELADSEIPAWLAADAQEDFDFTKTPPSRTYLIQPKTQTDTKNTRSIFIWTRHHLLVDGWSAHLVIDELKSAYATLLDHKEWRPSPAPSFASYVAWLQNTDSEASTAHWSEVLSDIEPQLELEAVRTPIQGGLGSRRIECDLTPDIAQKLSESAKNHGLTLSTLIHGAWAAVLANVSDGKNLIFGSTAAGRPADLPDYQSIVGNFINTVPIVADLSKEQGLVSWLQALQIQIVTSSYHGHISKRDMLVAAQLPPATPLFSSVVVFMNYPRADTSTDGLQITDSHYDEHSHYSVAFLVEPGEHLKLMLIHDLAEIDAHIADYLLDQVASRLAALPTAMHLSLSEYLQHGRTPPGHLPSTELSKPVVDVVTLLQETVQKFPNRIGLSCKNRHLSYSELSLAISSLAARLRKLGVVAQSNVVIVMPRSIEGLVAIWASLSLNATYVPLAVGSPVARIEEVANSCNAQLVVLETNMEGLETQCLHLSSIEDRAPLSDRPIVEIPKSQDIAYRIHTSGSTGKAKSVAVDHNQLGHSLAARLQFYGERPYRFALFSPLAFDSSVASIYWTVATGGELILVPDEIVQSPTATADYLLQHQVDALLTLPTVYSALLSVAPVELLERLKLVVVAGEACPTELFRAHSDAAANAALVNEYGPTEATVWCAAKQYQCQSKLDYETSSLPIGTSIPGVRLSVERTDGELCANGVIGELIVHGPTVAVSNRADGGYATGDLVQALPDGDLVFRGRKDQQIKIRGHRVEASEVEANIITHPAIDACAVIAQKVAPSTNVKVLNYALNRLPTAHALALLEEVEVKGA